MLSRTNAEMAKRPKETPSYHQKKVCVAGEPSLATLDHPTERPSHAAREGVVFREPSLSGNPSWNRNSSSSKGIVEPREVSPEAEQRRRKPRNRTNKNSSQGAANGHSASSASAAGNQDSKVDSLGAQYGRMCISCSDNGNKSPCRHGSMSSPRQTLPKDSQDLGLEPTLPEPVSKCLQGHAETSLPPEPVSKCLQGAEPVKLEGLQRAEPLLPPELVDAVIARIGHMREVLKLQPELGTLFKDAIHRPGFLRSRPDFEGEFSPNFLMTDDIGDLHWFGFDIKLREWVRLPSLNFAKDTLPSPDPDLFKDYLMDGDRGLLCINVGESTAREKLVICNPLTHEVKVLPPLIYARHPVLLHLKVDDDGHYKVFVAGSATVGTEALSLKTEVYDSRTGLWECPDGSDLPCPAFGLNEYQNGAYYKDSEREFLMCIAIIDAVGRGVLVYDIRNKHWMKGSDYEKLHIPVVRTESNVSHLATTQILGCGGSVFVFSEQECGKEVYYLIHKLSLDGRDNKFVWHETWRRKRIGGRGLLVYPESTCVPISEHELAIFNSVEHTTEIIDADSSLDVAALQIASPVTKWNRFHSLNPIGFVVKPSFRSSVCPRGHNPKFRCDLKRSEYCSECKRRAGPISENPAPREEIKDPTTKNFDLGRSSDKLQRERRMSTWSDDDVEAVEVEDYLLLRREALVERHCAGIDPVSAALEPALEPSPRTTADGARPSSSTVPTQSWWHRVIKM